MGWYHDCCSRINDAGKLATPTFASSWLLSPKICTTEADNINIFSNENIDVKEVLSIFVSMNLGVVLTLLFII